MKAWQVHSYGEDLQCCCIRHPIITKPSQLLVQIVAASVNPIDVEMQSTYLITIFFDHVQYFLFVDGYGRTFLNILRNQSPALPITLGRDFCGVIIDKGHGVSKKYKLGDRVYGMIPFNNDGSHAEITIAEQSNVR